MLLILRLIRLSGQYLVFSIDGNYHTYALSYEHEANELPEIFARHLTSLVTSMFYPRTPAYILEYPCMYVHLKPETRMVEIQAHKPGGTKSQRAPQSSNWVFLKGTVI